MACSVNHFYTMRVFLLCLLLFGACLIKAQNSFLDSIFWNIPFEKDVRSTIYLIENDKRFSVVQVDTTITLPVHPTDGDWVTFKVLTDCHIPNKASEILYSKWPFKSTIDNIPVKECLSFASGLEFTYRNKTAATKDFKRIAVFLRENLMAKRILSNEGHYEFYLSSNKLCSIVYLKLNADTRSIKMQYW